MEVSCGALVKWRATDQVVFAQLAEAVHFDLVVGIVAPAIPEWVTKDTWIEVRGTATFLWIPECRIMCRIDASEIGPAQWSCPEAVGAAECLTPPMITTRARVMGDWERRVGTW